MQGVANILDIVLFKVVTITKDEVVLGESLSWRYYFVIIALKMCFALAIAIGRLDSSLCVCLEAAF